MAKVYEKSNHNGKELCHNGKSLCHFVIVVKVLCYNGKGLCRNGKNDKGLCHNGKSLSTQNSQAMKKRCGLKKPG